MKGFKSARFGGIVALGAVSTVTAGALLAPASPAWASRQTRVAVVGRVDTPYGTQGTRGAGADVGIQFTLIDQSRRKTDVEVQYGIDRNGDGEILDDEYRTATENRIANGNTRRARAPQLFTTAGDIGAIQQFVWKSTADVQSDRLLTTEYKLDPQGREIADPDNPGSFLFEPVLPGVTIRVRAFRLAPDPVTG